MIDPNDPGWRLISDDPIAGKRMYGIEVHDDAIGDCIVYRTEYYRINALTDANSEQAANMVGQGWGDGKVVARLPMTMLFDESNGLMQAFREGDDKFINRWLNDGENRAFRVKEGRV